MSLPNLSYMMNVGQLRYIQSRFEPMEYRNPDNAASKFLSFRQRISATLRGKLLMQRLRANPFYYYVLARTKYYDEVFLDAIHNPVASILNIGCGIDTRSYRFKDLLKQRKITVFECDQPQAIHKKKKIASRLWPTDHVYYVPLDLNNAEWPDFSQILDEKRHAPALIMMEGVSPYVSDDSFKNFLCLLATKIHPQSIIAYDFKITGAAVDFGRSARAQHPFRLPAERGAVTAYHEALGFQLQSMELSSQLSKRLVPTIPVQFDEDCLLKLHLKTSARPEDSGSPLGNKNPK